MAATKVGIYSWTLFIVSNSHIVIHVSVSVLWCIVIVRVAYVVVESKRHTIICLFMLVYWYLAVATKYQPKPFDEWQRSFQLKAVPPLAKRFVIESYRLGKDMVNDQESASQAIYNIIVQIIWIPIKNHYRNQWWLVYRRKYASLGPNELSTLYASKRLMGNLGNISSVLARAIMTEATKLGTLISMGTVWINNVVNKIPNRTVR